MTDLLPASPLALGSWDPQKMAKLESVTSRSTLVLCESQRRMAHLLGDSLYMAPFLAHRISFCHQSWPSGCSLLPATPHTCHHAPWLPVRHITRKDNLGGRLWWFRCALTLPAGTGDWRRGGLEIDDWRVYRVSTPMSTCGPFGSPRSSCWWLRSLCSLTCSRK